MPLLMIMGCWLACAPNLAATCRPSASASSDHAVFAAPAIQWAAAGQAETRASTPATTTAAIRAGLSLNQDTIPENFGGREAAPGPVREDCGGLRCPAVVLDKWCLRSGAANALSYHRVMAGAAPWVLLIHQAASGARKTGPELHFRQI